MARGSVFWDEGKEWELRRLVSDGLSDEQIGERMGRSPKAIRARRIKLGLVRERGDTRRLRRGGGAAVNVELTLEERDLVTRAAEATGAFSPREWGAAVISNRIEEVEKRLDRRRRRQRKKNSARAGRVQMQLWFTTDERDVIKRVAKATGYSMGKWVRIELLREAHDVLHGYDPVSLEPPTPPNRTQQVCAALTVEEDDLVHEAAQLQGIRKATWAYAVLAGEIEASGARVQNPKGGYHKPWSPKMKKDLASLFKAGKKDPEIAAAMGLDVEAVKNARYRLGLVRRVKWTPETQALLRRMFEQGADDAEIAAAIPGATRAGVKNMRRKLRLQREMGIGPQFETLVKEFFELGYTVAETAEQTGLTQPQVSEARARLGLRKLGRWTEVQKTQLRELYEAGLSDREIGTAMGVGARSAESMRRRLGLPRDRFVWTPEHRVELTRLYRAGWSDEELAQHFGSTVKGVQTIRSTMGIVREILWTPERDAELRRLFAQQKSDDEIARVLGVPSAGGVRARRHQLGLRWRDAQFWTRARDVRLRDLFRQGASDDQIAAAIGVTAESVRNRRGYLRLGRGPLLVEEPRSESACARVTPATKQTADALARRLALSTSAWFRNALVDAATRTVVPEELPTRGRNPAALKRSLMRR